MINNILRKKKPDPDKDKTPFAPAGTHRRPTVRARIPVYAEGTEEQLSIRQSVGEIPEQQKSRSGEIVLSKYELLFHSIYDSVMLTDTEGNILEVNARAEYNFTWPADHLQAMTVLDLIAGADEELIKVINENVTDEKYLVIEASCTRSDESRFDADIVINRLTTVDGPHLCFFFRDVTSRKQAETELAEANAKLVESEKVRARSDTISTLVHEFNNPLQILICMAESDGNRELARQVNRMVGILNKLSSGQPLDTVTDDAGQTRYELPAEARAQCDPNRFLVVDDETMLRQMFVESLSMAFPDAMIDAASDGRQAVDLFNQKHHGLIIMDLSMPVMNGEEAYAEITKTCEAEGMASPSFLFCTGFMPSERIETIVGDESYHGFIKKPFTSGDLTTKVRTHLQKLADVVL